MNVDFLKSHNLPVYATVPKIIGLAGRARSGKDTFMLANEDLAYQEHRFAGPLKDFYTQATLEEVDWGREGSKQEAVPGFPCTRRDWLENVGQSICAWDPLFWVRIWANTLMAYSKNEVVFVPDVRKPIEAKVIQAYGGKVVRIYRPEVDNQVDEHPSTQAIDDIKWDFKITNRDLAKYQHEATETVDAILNDFPW